MRVESHQTKMRNRAHLLPKWLKQKGLHSFAWLLCTLPPLFLCGKGRFLFCIEHFTIGHHLISMHVNTLNTVQTNMY